MTKRKNSGETMVGLLIALVIIGILAAVYFMPQGGQSTRKDGKGTTTVGSVLYKSKDTVCKSNLSQIRQLIFVQTETNGEETPPPASLEEVRGLSAEMRVCSIGKEPYEYNPENGKVKCPHPGHEKY